MMAQMHRQTTSFLRKRLDEAGVRPDTRHGQNFLVDLNLVQLLVDAAELDERDVVLEVGTGTGSLTAMMAQRAGVVVTVELSAELHQLASEELVDFDNVVMLRQDALKNKNRLHPELLDAVRKQLAVDPQRRFKLAANLPYNIATPLISNLLATDMVPDSMTVTIQKELADRITARPSTKDYGALSIWVQSQCHAEVLRVLPPTVFWPRPKVHSAIIQIVPQRHLIDRIPDRPFFHTFVRSMFFHRRKFLRSVVLSAFKKQLTKPQVDDVLAALKLGPDARAEQLEVERMLELCEHLRAMLNEPT
jgi:16S rRNA (adenine1518-N6/adenine1519-N6)-dimethyltransferase